MKIGLIDHDGHNYPNLPLMKISAWHKAKGDSVEWYQPLLSGHMDIVYKSRVFGSGIEKRDFEYYVDADQIIEGGTGNCISVVNGKEIYDSSKDHNLPDEVEHMYPDYSLYPELTKDKAFGFLTRGCPRKCHFCIVKDKSGDGVISRKVADLSEFWTDQKYIELLDPNILACKDKFELLGQLSDSGAFVEFNQGLDARLCTEEVIDALNQIKIVKPHFAWDRYEDKKQVLPKLELISNELKLNKRCISVYVLTNYDTTFE